MFSFSIDADNMGRKWISPTPLNGNAEIDNGVDISPTITVDSQNRLLCVWTVTTFGLWATRYGKNQRIFGATSLDLGHSWSAPVVIDVSAAGDSWRPTVANTTNGFIVGFVTGADGTARRSVQVASWEPLSRQLSGIFENFAGIVDPIQMTITSFGRLHCSIFFLGCWEGIF